MNNPHNAELERNAEIKRVRLEGKLTLQEIADKYGLTRQRVHEIVKVNGIRGGEKKAKPEPKVKPTLEEKFFANIKHVGDCWEWTGTKSGLGYGCLRWNNTIIYATQVAWLLKHPGEVLPDRLRHSCKNKYCCNPDHLYVAEHK